MAWASWKYDNQIFIFEYKYNFEDAFINLIAYKNIWKQFLSQIDMLTSQKIFVARDGI